VDPHLLCSDPIASGGEDLYCCITFTVATTCALDSNAVCAPGSIGFSCTGGDTPDMADATLVCSQPTVTGGLAYYCCATM
jgi:hypothetical protein